MDDWKASALLTKILTRFSSEPVKLEDPSASRTQKVATKPAGPTKEAYFSGQRHDKGCDCQ